MARARDFNGSANETIVVSPKDVKGKVKDSILGKKARLWLLTINNPQNHGISLEQQEILERLKEDIASGAVTYVSSVMEQSLTTDENGKHETTLGFYLCRRGHLFRAPAPLLPHRVRVRVRSRLPAFAGRAVCGARRSRRAPYLQRYCA